jgi:hypothetical protein
VSNDDPEPKALIRRAERALHFGETIVMRAVMEKDDRLALQGLDRVRAALELNLKVHGLLAGDTQTDNRTVNIFQGWDREDVKRLLAQLPPAPGKANDVQHAPLAIARPKDADGP